MTMARPAPNEQEPLKKKQALAYHCGTMATVFITREMTSDSPLRARLETAGHAVWGQSLVAFRGAGHWTFDAWPRLDWIFFYSSRGAEFLAEGLQGAPLPGYVRLAALGPGTARAIERIWGRTADFVGSGEPLETSRAFAEAARGHTVLFPRARHSEQSVRRLLEDSVQSVDWVVYENVPLDEFACPVAEVLLFTSPLNARAYYTHCAPRGEKVLAIGETTAKALRELGQAKVWVAERASEDSLADLCLSVL
jgi:uroporphyrinogen-III synthase